MMKKLLLIALASTLLASGANAEWKYVEKVDEMTGKTKAIILSEQRNRTGAVAYVTADCKAPEEIVFAALFTDEQGEPVKLSNLKFHEEMGIWRCRLVAIVLTIRTGSPICKRWNIKIEFRCWRLPQTPQCNNSRSCMVVRLLGLRSTALTRYCQSLGTRTSSWLRPNS